MADNSNQYSEGEQLSVPLGKVYTPWPFWFTLSGQRCKKEQDQKAYEIDSQWRVLTLLCLACSSLCCFLLRNDLHSADRTDGHTSLHICSKLHLASSDPIGIKHSKVICTRITRIQSNFCSHHQLPNSISKSHPPIQTEPKHLEVKSGNASS
jgi:hypothetical protein